MLKTFSHQEKEYQEWLRNNRFGLVLTTDRKIKPDYMSLHKSDCPSINNYNKNHAKDGFTGQKYIKICSNHFEEIDQWRIEHNGGEFKLCKKCKPLPESNNVEQDSFRIEVNKSLKENDKRKARLSKAPKFAIRQISQTITYKRNPDVVAEVLLRANGICESCGFDAPFIRKSDQTPYLEVHHKKQLAHGGEDTIHNAIALCPNLY